ncbi:hypothetical protein BDN70DRAFT_364586 [Pholiota conissans]|uniref:Uncharacterized protein n=1 Tax=Pholiota conissans TaxID=109636 RepID=A0A9P5YRX8_9AGAR|nr:hypothetical protein BDN70DRAFT_364586 [Pholiota conissans]
MKTRTKMYVLCEILRTCKADGSEQAPPRYSSHRNLSTDVISEISHPHSGYVTAPASIISNIPAQRPPTRRSDSRPDVLHSDYDDEEGGELYTSPFDSDSDEGFYFPVPPRSTSTASASSGTKSAPAVERTMAKSRWALKLQLHNAQSMPSLQTGTGSSSRHHSHPAQPQPRSPPPDQRVTHQSHGSPPLEYAPDSYPPAVSVDTDVYKHAYNYPLVKQLSPIAEQDYFSPVIDSPTRAASLRFANRTQNASTGTRKASPGAESLASASATLLNGGAPMEDGVEAAEKESLKTRTGSGRTGSGGSVSTVNGGAIGLSRAGSASMGQLNGSPSEKVSPFLSRHLNRTASQSSSKSDSQFQVPLTPTPAQSQTSSQRQPSAQPRAGSPARPVAAHLLTSALRSSSTNNPTAANANPSMREVIQTPTSAGTTGTSTGTMYTPTSTLHASVQTPTSPSIVSGVTAAVQVPTIQVPPPAVINAPKLGLPKIPSLPALAPLDVRFSQVGADRASKSGSALRKSLAEVDRMPVIHSDEGHHNDEELDGYEYEDDSDHDDDEDGGYEIEVDEAEEDEDDDEYERESLHADSFVTAGTNEEAHPDIEQGMELTAVPPVRNTPPSSNPDTNQPPSRRSSNSAILLASATRQGSNASMGESRIFRRWGIDGHASPSPEPVVSSPITFSMKDYSTRWPFRPTSPPFLSAALNLTPAFWTFWLGFVFPVLWLIGGWHFTNAGELPPRVGLWEWYFWRSGWSISSFFSALSSRLSGCCGVRSSSERRPNKLRKTTRASHDSAVSHQSEGGATNTATPTGSPNPNLMTPAQRRRGKRRSGSSSAAQKAREGQVYPALPRWVAEKQSTVDGRMRLNDPKRSMRGISFGYPFIARPPGSSQDSSMSMGARPSPPPRSVLGRVGPAVLRVLGRPNRVLDLLYGVKLMEVRGRPESGRRMFDPWIQRCRYALCYALIVLAVGLCTASAWLITVNTRKVLGH